MKSVDIHWGDPDVFAVSIDSTKQLIGVSVFLLVFLGALVWFGFVVKGALSKTPGTPRDTDRETLRGICRNFVYLLVTIGILKVLGIDI